MARSFEDLVERWEQIAKHAAEYNLTLDDWLNDLDVRDIIERRMAEQSDAGRSSLRSRLSSADHRFRAATIEATQSLWGPTAGADHHPARQWWYFRYPSAPGASMRHDLETAGIFRRRER